MSAVGRAWMGQALRQRAVIFSCAPSRVDTARRFMHRSQPLLKGIASSGNDGVSYSDHVNSDAGSSSSSCVHDSEEMERRRIVYDRCKSLRECISLELRAEVERDAQDGTAAIPPMAPSGWAVDHQPGTSFFTMQRTLHRQAGKGADDAEEARFRSVYADQVAEVVETPNQNNNNTSNSMTIDGAAAAPSATTPHQVPSSAEGKALRRMTEKDVLRSDVHLQLVVPFRVLDLSLVDPSVDICEWSRFSLLVRKVCPSAARGRTRLLGQQRIWDQDTSLYFQLATANSELRIRSVQFLSKAEARALEEHAAFGQGDPYFLELLRHQQSLESRTTSGSKAIMYAPPMTRTPTAAATRLAETYSPPSRRFVKPTTAAAAPHPIGVSDDRPDNFGADVLTRGLTRAGDTARSLVYHGPYVTELSKELREALMHYLLVDLGVGPHVWEYACQMQFFMEQEEYMGWLVRWRHAADHVQQSLL